MPESSQLLSVKFNGKRIEWTKEQLTYFWKNEFIKSFKEVSPGFVVDDSNRDLIISLYDYVWHRQNSFFDIRKGLLFHGPIGVGKSTLLKGLQIFEAKINRNLPELNKNSPFGFQLKSATEICLLYSENGIRALDKFTCREIAQSLAIDEVGRESLDSKNFGTSINVIQTVLQLRYEFKDEFYTHMTTNLDPNTDFAERYDYYIADRIKEMFNIIKIEGSSRRKQ